MPRKEIGKLSLLTSMLLALTLLAVPSAIAYGQENWQIGFAGTGVAPTTGFGFGFWGWCTFGGGVTSGNNGDCHFSNYVHTSAGDITCQVSLDITSWSATGGTFVTTGTAAVTPASLTGPCLAIAGVPSSSFSGFDTMIPATPGHFNLGTFDGLKGEFQLQVTQIP